MALYIKKCQPYIRHQKNSDVAQKIKQLVQQIQKFDCQEVKTKSYPNNIRKELFF